MHCFNRVSGKIMFACYCSASFGHYCLWCKYYLDPYPIQGPVFHIPYTIASLTSTINIHKQRITYNV